MIGPLESSRRTQNNIEWPLIRYARCLLRLLLGAFGSILVATFTLADTIVITGHRVNLRSGSPGKKSQPLDQGPYHSGQLFHVLHYPSGVSLPRTGDTAEVQCKVADAHFLVLPDVRGDLLSTAR